MKAVLITRPMPDLDRSIAAFTAAGLTAIPAPVMAIEVFNDAPRPASDFTAVAFTSANGVRAYQVQAWATPCPAYCVGPASADQAQRAGHPIAAIAESNVESLAAAISGNAPKGRLLHARGESAAGDLLGALGDRGIAADAAVLYRAEPATRFAQPALDFLSAGDVGIALYSPRTAALFADLAAKYDQMDNLRRCQALCLSPAVAEAAKTLPFSHIHVAPSPEERALIDMVKTLCT